MVNGKDTILYYLKKYLSKQIKPWGSRSWIPPYAPRLDHYLTFDWRIEWITGTELRENRRTGRPFCFPGLPSMPKRQKLKITIRSFVAGCTVLGIKHKSTVCENTFNKWSNFTIWLGSSSSSTLESLNKLAQRPLLLLSKAFKLKSVITGGQVMDSPF